jgi:hypothetical protein
VAPRLTVRLARITSGRFRQSGAPKPQAANAHQRLSFEKAVDRSSCSLFAALANPALNHGRLSGSVQHGVPAVFARSSAVVRPERLRAPVASQCCV